MKGTWEGWEDVAEPRRDHPHNTADSVLRPILQSNTVLVMGEAKETQSSLCRGIALQITQG